MKEKKQFVLISNADCFAFQKNSYISHAWNIIYLLTEWEGQPGIYWA